MGKRGPAPKGEYTGKSKVLSTRITPELREALEAAKAKSRRSLSQEIEDRLQRTFIEDQNIALAFGSRLNFTVLRIVAMAIQLGTIHYRGNDDDEALWLDDPHLFDQTVKTVVRVLESFRPPMQREAAPRAGAPSPEVIAELVSLSMVGTVVAANPSAPLHTVTLDEHRMGRMKSELGPLLSRVLSQPLSEEDMDAVIEASESFVKRMKGQDDEG